MLAATNRCPRQPGLMAAGYIGTDLHAHRIYALPPAEWGSSMFSSFVV